MAALLFSLLMGCFDGQGTAWELPILGGPAAQLTEQVRIDGRAEDLVPIGSVAVHDDGHIAIMQMQDAAVRLFSPEGRPLGTFGRKGEAPGEFMQPNRIGWQGDTLWIIDRGLDRITFVSINFELVRTQAHLPRSVHLDAPNPVGPDAEFFVLPYAPTADGYLVAGLTARHEGPPEPFARYTLSRLDRQGVVQNVILPFHREARFIGRFRESSHDLVMGAGRAAVATATLEGPEAGTLSLIAVNLDGDTVVARRFAFPIEEVPTDVADSMRRIHARRVATANWTSTPRLRIPSTYPPITKLLIGHDSSFWMQARAADGWRRYHVLATNGDPVGTVSVPDNSWVAGATLGRIWVIEKDSLGVESVVVYRVEW